MKRTCSLSLALTIALCLSCLATDKNHIVKPQYDVHFVVKNETSYPATIAPKITFHKIQYDKAIKLPANATQKCTFKFPYSNWIINTRVTPVLEIADKKILLDQLLRWETPGTPAFVIKNEHGKIVVIGPPKTALGISNRD